MKPQNIILALTFRQQNNDNGSYVLVVVILVESRKSIFIINPTSNLKDTETARWRLRILSQYYAFARSWRTRNGSGRILDNASHLVEART